MVTMPEESTKQFDCIAIPARNASRSDAGGRSIAGRFDEA